MNNFRIFLLISAHEKELTDFIKKRRFGYEGRSFATSKIMAFRGL